MVQVGRLPVHGHRCRNSQRDEINRSRRSVQCEFVCQTHCLQKPFQAGVNSPAVCFQPSMLNEQCELIAHAHSNTLLHKAEGQFIDVRLVNLSRHAIEFVDAVTPGTPNLRAQWW